MNREFIVYILCLHPTGEWNGKQKCLEIIQKKFHYHQLIDFTSYESENLFLEGTGSMVLDRDNRFAYACLSPRTNLIVLKDFCKKLDYQPIVFHSADKTGEAIYHTNVMMCVADRYVVICLDSIPDAGEKKYVKETLLASAERKSYPSAWNR